MRAHASISTLRTYHGRARSMVDCMWCYCNYNEGGEYIYMSGERGGLCGGGDNTDGQGKGGVLRAAGLTWVV